MDRIDNYCNNIKNKYFELKTREVLMARKSNYLLVMLPTFVMSCSMLE